MNYWPNFKIYILLLVAFSFNQLHAQTTINAGNVKGIWQKAGSPFMVKGDINISLGDSLTIEPGVKVIFEGHHLLNIQGTLNAKGTKDENILFTGTDSIDFKGGSNKGWAGIHFDRRPVTWDTILFFMPENEEIRNLLIEQINMGNLDTATSITLSLQIPDLVNDTLLSDSIFLSKTGSNLEYCQFKYSMAAGRTQPYVFGGAIYIYRYSNLIISNCCFENNFAYAGGALYCKEAAPLISSCTFKNCKAQSSGGAMVFVHSGPIITSCKFIDNGSGHNGGGMLFYESTPYVMGNTIRHNTAFARGGGIYCENNIDTMLSKGTLSPVNPQKFKRDSLFTKKKNPKFSLQYTTSYYGRFLNNIISSNSAIDGGGIGLAANAPELTNNTIIENTADSTCGGILCYMSSPVVNNSIIYDNHDSKGKSQVYLFENSNPVISYCNIEAGQKGIKKDKSGKNSCKTEKITDALPSFVDPLSGNYELKKGSKCIDIGIPDFSSLKLPSYDLSGKNRVTNKIIDLGALEYTPASAASDKPDPLSEPLIKSASESSDTSAGPLKDGLNEIYTVVYPNPNEGIFSVAIHNNKYEDVSIDVYSSSGQLVYKRDYKAHDWFEQEVDLSGATAGMYIVVIYSDENILYNGQLLIER